MGPNLEGLNAERIWGHCKICDDLLPAHRGAGRPRHICFKDGCAQVYNAIRQQDQRSRKAIKRAALRRIKEEEEVRKLEERQGYR